jgi:arylsulfatase
VGRVLDAAAALPDADNTLVIYILGDNGSSAEGGLDGSTNEIAGFNGILEDWQSNLKHIDELGGPKHYNHFPAGWAWAMDTPFQWTKQIASHFGGTRNPVVISWPAKIKEKAGYAPSSTTSWTSCLRFSSVPAFRLRGLSTASPRNRSRA